MTFKDQAFDLLDLVEGEDQRLQADQCGEAVHLPDVVAVQVQVDHTGRRRHRGAGTVRLPSRFCLR